MEYYLMKRGSIHDNYVFIDINFDIKYVTCLSKVGRFYNFDYSNFICSIVENKNLKKLCAVDMM